MVKRDILDFADAVDDALAKALASHLGDVGKLKNGCRFTTDFYDVERDGMNLIRGWSVPLILTIDLGAIEAKLNKLLRSQGVDASNIDFEVRANITNKKQQVEGGAKSWMYLET